MSTSSDRDSMAKDVDIEKSDQAETRAVEIYHSDDGVNRQSGIFGKMWKAVLYLDKFGVEVRGIERVPPTERHHKRIADIGLLWLSANTTISTFSLGTLGSSIWYMGLVDACLTILFFNLLATCAVSTFSTWGKQTGLRQMVISRYSFGSIAAYFPILLNAFACIGWSTINTIVGSSALRAVSTTHKLPSAVGIIIIALLTLVVALFGYRHIHMVERVASIPIIIIFLIMLGQAAPYFTTGVGGVGETEAASVLSFGAAIFGFAIGWASLAADYTVNFPEDESNTKVWLWTFFGLNVPMILIEVLGACMMTTFTAKTTWGDAYDADGLGGLLMAGLSPAGGFGKFCVVLLALSIVANNIPNIYSFSLTFQAFGKYAQAIPRIFLCVAATIIYIVLAIAGADHFESALDTLLVLLSYWLAIYTMILLEEHFIFRKGSFANYDLDSYNTFANLPLGLGAIAAICVGIVGAAMGMASIWFVGPLGRLIGDPKYGGDIGFLLSGSFAGVTYPIARYLEKKYVGR